MPKKKLTKKEKDTLWALVNFPTLNDKDLAKKTRLKLSTVTAIRRRLRQRGYFRTVNIPNFYRIGFELLSVEYGTFNEAVPIEKRIGYFKDFVEPEPNAVFSIMSRSNGIVFIVARNYAEANKQHEKLEMFLTSHRLSDVGDWKRAIFPFQTSRFWNFFNFSPIVKYSYDIQRKMNLSEFSSEKGAKVLRLSKKEKRVLYGLIKYPEDSDNNIADRFDVSRQAVSSIKKRFMKEDLISTQRIINFERTGCKLLMFAYTFFGPKAPLEMRGNGIDHTKRSIPAFMGVSSNFENIIFAATKNYHEFDRIKEGLLSFYKTHLSIPKPPEILLFPVPDLFYRKSPTFHGLLGDFLDIEEE